MTILQSIPVKLKHILRDSRIAHDVMDLLSICMNLPRVVNYYVPNTNLRTETYSDGYRCDVYVSKLKHSPVVLFVHGGAWGTGNRTMYRILGTSLQSRDIAVVIPSYETWPDGDALDQAFRIRKCIEWCKCNISKIGNGNPNRIHLVGHSSGAHICALALTFEGEAREYNLHDEGCNHHVVNGYVGLSGVYSIPDHFRFEKRRGVEELSPMAPANQRFGKNQFPTFMSPSLTPSKIFQTDRVLLLHGSKDNVVPCQSTIRFKNSKLLSGVGHVNCRIVRDANHIDPIMSLMSRQGEFFLRICCFVKGDANGPRFSTFSKYYKIILGFIMFYGSFRLLVKFVRVLNLFRRFFVVRV